MFVFFTYLDMSRFAPGRLFAQCYSIYALQLLQYIMIDIHKP